MQQEHEIEDLLEMQLEGVEVFVGGGNKGQAEYSEVIIDSPQQILLGKRIEFL